MASREHMARTIGHLKDLGPFRDYVKTLQTRRDDAIERLLDEDDESKVSTRRAEARVYNSLMREIAQAIKDQT